MVSRTSYLIIAGLPLVLAGPPEVPGFSLTWSEDFIGSANSLPDLGSGKIDTGTTYPGGPANWATGEI